MDAWPTIYKIDKFVDQQPTMAITYNMCKLPGDALKASFFYELRYHGKPCYLVLLLSYFKTLSIIKYNFMSIQKFRLNAEPSNNL